MTDIVVKSWLQWCNGIDIPLYENHTAQGIHENNHMLTTCNPGGNTSVARLWIVRSNTKWYFKIPLIICLLAYDLAGPSALSRFDRDVLSLPDTTHMIVLLGINDIGFPRIRMTGTPCTGPSI